ncbi:hypothetical protein IKJ53_00905, partial [bacterium]|nr:hypothetical protein [bacterium]
MRKKLFDRKNFGNSWGFSKLCASFLLVISFILPSFSAETLLIETLYSGNLYISERGTNDDFSYYTSIYDVRNGGIRRTYYKETFNEDALNYTTLVTFSVESENEQDAIKINFFNNKTFWLKYEIAPTTVVNTDVYTVLADNDNIELLFSKALNGSILNSMQGITIESMFIENYSMDTASSVSNSDTGIILKINSTFAGNYSNADGGAVSNDGTIYYIDSMFLGNYT